MCICFRYTVLSEGSLRVHGVQLSDAGRYYCTVSNQAGSDHRGLDLRVFGNKATTIVQQFYHNAYILLLFLLQCNVMLKYFLGYILTCETPLFSYQWVRPSVQVPSMWRWPKGSELCWAVRPQVHPHLKYPGRGTALHSISASSLVHTGKDKVRVESFESTTCIHTTEKQLL